MTGQVEEGPGGTGRPADGPDVGAVPAAGAGGAERAAEGPDAGAPEPAQRRSGLRNPEKAVRGLGAGTLALEALVLLLAIQPIRLVGGDLGGAAMAAIVALAVACVVLAGRMGRPWAWHAGSLLQGLLMLSGLLHWSLLVLGVIFALVWAYALHVRRVILG
ncbi:DUF4233 domain-containing protein [Micromonospora inositola]|uniref:DUF4233 domain-containing protein n=1 Tax=Micromonospora inositola TaxID=47865 RepID=A0A1C5INJ5_9ACTN|nr:DUF4233 domain-containing protein [Micromonospora inositola]SCG59900.1 Protein of unknown function [Micromonospora inositola]